ncbi:unnamed protein product [Rhizopus stolonifer]
MSFLFIYSLYSFFCSPKMFPTIVYLIQVQFLCFSLSMVSFTCSLIEMRFKRFSFLLCKLPRHSHHVWNLFVPAKSGRHNISMNVSLYLPVEGVILGFVAYVLNWNYFGVLFSFLAI